MDLRRLSVAIVVGLLGSLLWAGPALGATLTVMNNNDMGSGSLRDAIGSSSAGDTIQFAPALDGQTITLTSGELLISHNLTITGPGAGNLTISGNNNSRVFDLQADTVTVSGLTVTQGLAPSGQAGGAILDLGGPDGGTDTFAGVAVTNSQLFHDSDFGGGMAIGATANPVNVNITGSTFSGDKQTALAQYNSDSSGALHVSNSTFTNNQHGPLGTSGEGGALVAWGPTTISNSTFAGNQSTTGGAIRTQGTASFSISGSTFIGNHAVGSGSNVAAGGAIFINSPAVTLTNDTFTGNRADSTSTASIGGAIFTCCGNGSSTNLVNDTVDANSVTGPSSTGGDIGSGSGPAARILNSIVADGVSATPGFQNCAEFETSLGHNISTGNCGFSAAGDKINTSPKLGPLANNGGPTQTMALLPGSPAIDAGTNSGCPATDQRGVHRPQGAACDIGAFEYQPTGTHANCSLSLKGKVSFGKAKGKKHKARPGFLVATLKCDQAVSATLSGKLVESKKHKHGKSGNKTLSLGPLPASLSANVAQTLKVKLSKAAVKALKKGTRESVTLMLTASNANGSSTASATVTRLKR